MKRILTAIGAVVLLVLGGAAGSIAADYMEPADPDNPIAMRGCVIRFDTLSETGYSVIPRIHANETHTCVGVTDVQADWSGTHTHGDLRVYHHDNNGKPIVSMMADESGTLVEKGIECGTGGGGGITRVRCYDTEGNKVDAQSLKLYDPFATLWLTWVMWDDTES